MLIVRPRSSRQVIQLKNLTPINPAGGGLELTYNFNRDAKLELIMKILDLTLTYEEGMRGVAFENAKFKSLWKD